MTDTDRNKVVNLIDELIEYERRLEEMIDANAFPSTMQSGGASLLGGLRATSRHQREALERQRERIGVEAPSAQVPPSARLLGEVYAALTEVAFAYAVLHARAHRAYDSQGEGNTADLAESHLRAYTGAIQQFDILISDLVVSELGSIGEDCLCQCPACSVGLCLCAPHGMVTVRKAWQETIPSSPEGGLRVRRPRTGSDAERAGLLDGDHILAIDGQEITTDFDISIVQTAIRTHAPGDKVQLRVLREGSGPLELTLHRG